MVSSTLSGHQASIPATGLRRRFIAFGGMWSMICAFFGGIFASYLIFQGHASELYPLGNELSTKIKEATDIHFVDKPTPSVQSPVEVSDTSATEGFINAWRQDRETCKQWISMQSMSQSYLDAYIVGSQKGATSEITKRLFKLGVRHDGMKKEWHFFNKLAEDGTLTNEITSHKPVLPQGLNELRYGHYKAGFPDDTKARVDAIPVIDRRNISQRMLAYDGTVEHFHTDKAAFMAHALTPHAKIIATVRNPIDRALSQFNMVIRTYNKNDAAAGKGTKPPTPEWFHEVAENEIEKITQCGYDASTATIDRPTSKMLSCVFGEGKVKFENLLYITRGLYHVHIATWRNYFPDHRMFILSFHDITTGKKEVHQDLTKFLCIRPFTKELLKDFEETGSALSFGEQVAKGMDNRGNDDYEKKNNTYLLAKDIFPETRKLLNDFYRPANIKLEALLGRKMYDYE